MRAPLRWRSALIRALRPTPPTPGSVGSWTSAPAEVSPRPAIWGLSRSRRTGEGARQRIRAKRSAWRPAPAALYGCVLANISWRGGEARSGSAAIKHGPDRVHYVLCRQPVFGEQVRRITGTLGKGVGQANAAQGPA